MRARLFAWTVGSVTLIVSGCAAPGQPTSRLDDAGLRDRAVEVVKRAVRYKPLGSVRAQGLEAMQRRLGSEALPWLRNALDDEDPGVRFASILALGALDDRTSYGRIHGLAEHDNASLRVAVYYALHRMGDTQYSAQLPAVLLDDPSAAARQDAAFVLGLLGEGSAVRLLAKAMKDRDASVQRQALASMALLGSGEAIQQLTFAVNSGTGGERLAALIALADLGRPELANTFRYKLRTGEYIEEKLAAARGLGLLGSREGLEVALGAAGFDSPRRDVGHDPPAEQIARVRQLAATALGAIRDRRALPVLRQRLYDASYPHVQVAAADAILQILGGPAAGRPSRPVATMSAGSGTTTPAGSGARP